MPASCGLKIYQPLIKLSPVCLACHSNDEESPQAILFPVDLMDSVLDFWNCTGRRFSTALVFLR